MAHAAAITGFPGIIGMARICSRHHYGVVFLDFLILFVVSLVARQRPSV
jgi:uncharacterized membrane protein YtjA (UPF0391 family)